MATVSVSSVTANYGTQNLYTVNQLPQIGNASTTGNTALAAGNAITGAYYYGTVTQPVQLSTAGNVVQVGTSVTQANGVFTLAANSSWLLTATVSLTGQISSVNPPNYGFYNVTTGSVVGALAPVGQALTTTINNATGNTVQVGLYLEKTSGNPFRYPNRLMSATATVVELSGSTAA